MGVAVGDINQNGVGRYCSISKLASSLIPDCPPPTVLIETRDSNLLVKDYDGVTVVLKCAPTED